MVVLAFSRRASLGMVVYLKISLFRRNFLRRQFFREQLKEEIFCRYTGFLLFVEEQPSYFVRLFDKRRVIFITHRPRFASLSLHDDFQLRSWRDEIRILFNYQRHYVA